MSNNLIARTEASIKGVHNASENVRREIRETEELLGQFKKKPGPSEHLLLAQRVTAKPEPIIPLPTIPMSPQLPPSPPPSRPSSPRGILSGSATPVTIGAVHGGKTKKRRKNKRSTRKNRRKTRNRK